MSAQRKIMIQPCKSERHRYDALRYSQCNFCKSERQRLERKYWKREEILAAGRRSRRRHIEKCRARVKAYADKHKAERSAYDFLYYRTVKRPKLVERGIISRGPLPSRQEKNLVDSAGVSRQGVAANGAD